MTNNTMISPRRLPDPSPLLPESPLREPMKVLEELNQLSQQQLRELKLQLITEQWNIQGQLGDKSRRVRLGRRDYKVWRTKALKALGYIRRDLGRVKEQMHVIWIEQRRESASWHLRKLLNLIQEHAIFEDYPEIEDAFWDSQEFLRQSKPPKEDVLLPCPVSS